MHELTDSSEHDSRQTSLLAESHLQVDITDLFAEYCLTHRFRNNTREAVEAVYTFPVPLDAAFLGMEAMIAGEHLIAHVQAKKKAARRYDDALAEGDSAVLLESFEPGLLCVSLGNLKPGERGEIVLRFTAPLRSCDGTARFSLPLVHRPRYGRDELDELEMPTHDFAVEHRLEASINVHGLLAGLPVSCATHAVRFFKDGQVMRLQLNQAMLDRDLVLAFDLPNDLPTQGHLVKDGDAAIGVLSFNTAPSRKPPTPSEICLVLDGSGSMMGDAIDQSRAAVQSVADALLPEDRIQVLRFGSDVLRLFRRAMPVTSRVREILHEQAEAIEANLGGTNMDSALGCAIDALRQTEHVGDSNRVIILVTDGAVEPEQLTKIKNRAKADGVRIFVVAVGSSAGVDALTPLASETLGVLERAVPAEPIDEVVLRQLRRMREPQPLTMTIDWSNAQATSLQLPITYPGDAVMAFSFLPEGLPVQAKVNVSGESSERVFTFETLESSPALRALAGQAAYQQANKKSREVLAQRYSLISPYTSAVLVKQRVAEDKIEGLPHVKSIAHMLPHGMVTHDRGPSTAVSHGVMARGGVMSMPPPVPILVRDLGSPYRTRTTTTKKQPTVKHKDNPRALAGLHAALVQLLFKDAVKQIDLALVLAKIEPALQKDIQNYLVSIGIDRLNISTAYSLLERLINQGVGEALSDEEEVLFTQQHMVWLWDTP